MSSPANPGTQGATIPMGLRILAIVLRALFLGALAAITVRLSRPQSETIWSVYETPGDLIRLMLGVAVCLWIVLDLFMLPRTAEGYRSWVYLGLVVAPLAWASPSPSGDGGLAHVRFEGPMKPRNQREQGSRNTIQSCRSRCMTAWR